MGRAEEADAHAPLVGMWGVAPHPQVNERPSGRNGWRGGLTHTQIAAVDRRLLRHAHTYRGARQLERSTIQKSDNILRPT